MKWGQKKDQTGPAMLAECVERRSEGRNNDRRPAPHAALWF
jgi:hypothetical protein